MEQRPRPSPPPDSGSGVSPSDAAPQAVPPAGKTIGRRGQARAAGQAAALDPRLRPFIDALAELVAADLVRRPPKQE